jgi:DNA polymerase IV
LALAKAAVDMLCQRLPDRRLSVRRVGVGVSGFDSPDELQRLLFNDEKREVESGLDRATDHIRERYGADALSRGSRLLHEVTFKAMPRPASGES